MMHTPLCSPTDQGIRADLSRWGTAPSWCPVVWGTVPFRAAKRTVHGDRQLAVALRRGADLACDCAPGHKPGDGERLEELAGCWSGARFGSAAGPHEREPKLAVVLAGVC
eukprot:3248708-Prymnesium_polylepis.2